MKIELKKLSINLRMSEETTMFIADLFIDGKKAGTAENCGHGGPTNYSGTSSDGAILIEKAEAYFKGLPEALVEIPGVESFMSQPTLESAIDDVVYAEMMKKEMLRIEKKIAKDCEKSICYGNKETGYKMLGWKGRTIAQVLQHPTGLQAVKKALSEVRGKLGKGESILNTNLPAEVMTEDNGFPVKDSDLTLQQS